MENQAKWGAKMKKFKVFFMGAGEIAIPIFEKLLQAQSLELVGCATQIDRPAGRKKILTPTPVGARAAELGIPIEKVERVNEESYVRHIEKLEPDFIVVVSFAQILREPLLNLPKIACINIHSSLLPKFRGASPVISALLAREKTSGITFMKMEKGLDSGPVYRALATLVEESDTAGTLEQRLGMLAGASIESVLLEIASGQLQPFAQEPSQVTFCSKFKKSDGIIDLNRDPAAHINAKIHAFNPWPMASIELPMTDGSVKNFFLCDSRLEDEISPLKSCVIQADKNALRIAGADGRVVCILSILVPGKKMMSFREFLNGYRLQVKSL